MKKFFSKVNPSTLSGALDIVVVEHEDGTLRSSPWHLVFGKLGLIHHLNKIISVSINDKPAPFMMYVDKDGRGQFFASQSVKKNVKSENEKAFPTVSLPAMRITPGDVRNILKGQKGTEKKEQKNEDDNFSTFITRDSAVDLDAALDYDDPDPEPITTTASSIDLAQSLSTTNEEFVMGPEMEAPVPSSIILNSMRPLLNYGKNQIDFTVSSLLQGPKTIICLLYLWKSDVKIVISDVDGTVTSSDVLGQVLPSIGKDWTHPGLAKLYQEIASHGINFLYMSSRPIGEANYTRNYLLRVDQGGIKLPDGPLITCPDKLFPALTREVIKRQPHLFKIPTLAKLIKLFDPLPLPFVFGFGNRDTDVISYAENGIIRDRVFLFDKQHKVLDSSGKVLYKSINDFTPHVEEVFREKGIIQ